MATPRNRARNFGGGGGGLLGALMAIYGGNVSANPELASAEGLAANADTFVGPYTAEQEGLMESYKAGKIEPFKAKNIFAKPRASELNAEYQANKLAQANQTNEAVKLFNTLSPSRLKELQASEGIKVQAELDKKARSMPLDKEMGKFQTDESIRAGRVMGNNAMLQRNNVVADELENNLGSFDIKVSPRAIDALASGYDKELQVNKSDEAEAKSRGDQILLNAPAKLRQSQRATELQGQQIEADIAGIPDQVKMRKKQLELIDSNIKAGKFSFFGGDGIFDNDTGEIIKQPTPRAARGDLLNAIKEALGGETGDIKTGVQPTARPTPTRLPLVDLGDGRKFDPNTGKIIQ